jgi:hypothetical protein
MDQPPAKRPRGRPRKSSSTPPTTTTSSSNSSPTISSNSSSSITSSTPTTSSSTSSPTTSSSSSKSKRKVWDCFQGWGRSKWTWAEDYQLIQLACDFRANWGKVASTFQQKGIGQSFLDYGDMGKLSNKLRKRFDTLAGPQSS